MLVPTRGFEFDVFTDGPDDGPVVLLLHGFPQHSGQWHAVIPALNAAGMRTIAFDQRGYSPGARPTDAKDYALVECIADAVSIMDSFGLQRCHVVGHDWGSAVAWGLAATHPDRLSSLTAMSGPHPGALSAALSDPEADQRARFAYMAYFANVDKAVPGLLANDAEQLRSAFTGSGMNYDELERYIAPLRDPDALRGALSWYTAIFAYPPPRYGPVAVPTTYLWSNRDIALGRDAAYACERFVTGDYRFIELDGVSHWICDQAPEATIKAIVEQVRATA